MAPLCFCFFFSCSLFPETFFCLCVWQVCCCGTFICLALMAASHYHNTKLPTIDRECLFNHPGRSSSPAPPVCLALPHFHVRPLAIGPAAVPFTAFGLQSKSRVDALCQVILSLGKSATGHGKMALTCLYTGSDGWVPVSVAALVAQGPFTLALSETCSCPNEQRWDVRYFNSTQMQCISPQSS